MKWILKKFGYYRCDYGFSCGRHYLVIDGKTIAQTDGDDLWLRDEDIHRIGYALFDQGRFWEKP